MCIALTPSKLQWQAQLISQKIFLRNIVTCISYSVLFAVLLRLMNMCHAYFWKLAYCHNLTTHRVGLCAISVLPVTKCLNRLSTTHFTHITYIIQQRRPHGHGWMTVGSYCYACVSCRWLRAAYKYKLPRVCCRSLLWPIIRFFDRFFCSLSQLWQNAFERTTG